MKIKRALISVSDKTGIEDFARGLQEFGVSIVSSGGTARLLARAGIQVQTVSDVTGSPEMLDGRVKTLHPRIHGGILADRRKPQHLQQLKEQGITPIDLVVCNLYPFTETVSSAEVTDDEAVEQIDIGGPAMVRAAAKNYRSVAVVVNPANYSEVLAEMGSRSGSLTDETRKRLAAQAFIHTAGYDVAISDWMQGSSGFPDRVFLTLDKQLDLRYGENPHQAGAFYSHPLQANAGPGWSKVSGKELSFTNLLDFDAAWRLVRDFEEPAAAIIKHTNPCGCAVGSDTVEAFERALECDPRSAFGGIIALNRSLDSTSTAKRINELKAHIVTAPSYTPEALKVLKERKVLIVLETNSTPTGLELRSAAGGVLVQQFDSGFDGRDQMTVVSTKQPEDSDWDDLLFAWHVTQHVKSNSAVFAQGGQAFGVGAGQMSRVDAVELAARRAGDRAKGAVLATDGFFPFRDGLDSAVEAGARAVVAPGGGVRDPEVIAAADEHGIPLVFTEKRHFRH
jgi:phosphoribosylaminoimidazolecarboxamide formyltransferase / IMP cyclohydrolase